MDTLTLSIEDLYEAVKDRAEVEGAYSRDEWNDLVEEVLEERRDTIGIDDDDELEYLVESLRSRFEQYAQVVPEL